MSENNETPATISDSQQNTHDSVIEKKAKSILAKKMNRRQFLWRSAEVIIAAPVVLKAIEEIIYDGIRGGLETPGISDALIRAVNKLGEQAPNSENSEARPILEIINEAIQNYKRANGKEVVYKRSKDYKDIAYYSNVLEEASSGIELHDPKKVIDTIKDSLPEEVKEAYVFSDTRSSQFIQLFPRGSGFFNQLKEQYPDIFDEKDTIVNYGKYYSKVSEVGKDIMMKAKAFVEARSLTNGPVSSSVVLEYFLNMNKGDLSQSIFDTTIFLRTMARNNPETGAEEISKKQEQWFIDHIKDEYQGPSYTHPQSGESVINLVGKPYHSWNLVALLEFFPVEMIHASGIYRQLITFSEQGIGKTRGDLETMTNLRAIEKSLLAYSSKPEPSNLSK